MDFLSCTIGYNQGQQSSLTGKKKYRCSANNYRRKWNKSSTRGKSIFSYKC